MAMAVSTDNHLLDLNLCREGLLEETQASTDRLTRWKFYPRRRVLCERPRKEGRCDRLSRTEVVT